MTEYKDCKCKKWRDLKNHYKLVRNFCWIVGSGPSLDTIDLECLGDDPIFACNAAITYVCKHKDCWPNLWWIFNNSSAYRWSCEKLGDWKPRSVSLYRQTYHHVKHKDAYFYDDVEAFPNHTTAETMIRLAHHMGIKTAILLGVDCDKTAKESYAKGLMYAKCIYNMPGNDRRDEYFSNFQRGIRLTLEDLGDMKLVTCSSMYPDKTIPYIPFETLMDLLA